MNDNNIEARLDKIEQALVDLRALVNCLVTMLPVVYRPVTPQPPLPAYPWIIPQGPDVVPTAPEPNDKGYTFVITKHTGDSTNGNS